MSDFDSATLFSVKGLVAVITGGGTEALEKAASTAKHANIHPIRADVTSKSDLSAAVTHLEQKHGYINLLIANSGITGPLHTGLQKDGSLSHLQSTLYSLSSEGFAETFAINTSAVYFTVVAFLGLLGNGNEKGNVEQKSQVIAMMKQFATMLAPHGIRSNVIVPGVYPSQLTDNFFGNLKDYAKDFVPAQRVWTPSDMAGTVLFLTSKAGGYVNGNVLVTDGGRLSIIPSTY
ncbi:NAD(P)-binding protein [Byssothecium circinans]|uniref:NAD(P)-binding protein n=1 Tax=Byssothecium circinans TaxID=147558 RepID=A0A6A5UHC5_9PLEO|nr:NAD(P)-binding protein [Byssothecium circinans]